MAAFLLAIGALVVGDSLRVGIGWADDGPRSGLLSFYVGLFLIGASGWTALRALLGRSPLKAGSPRARSFRCWPCCCRWWCTWRRSPAWASTWPRSR